MSHRYVGCDVAKDEASAEAVIISETGGACVPTGNTQKIGDGAGSYYSVEVFSGDGHSAGLSIAARGRLLLKVVAVSSDGKTCRIREASGFEYDSPREVPAFLPSTPDELLTLSAGDTISCKYLPGAPGQIIEAFNEVEVFERREFDGAPDETIGWCPGIATGNRFTKE